MTSKKKAFTLVELLAVIVILAIILVIVVPRILEVIRASKVSSMEDSAKLIVKSAESKKLEREALGDNTKIECSDVAEYNSNDYDSCNITFNNGVATITLKGKGKFDKLTCTGTKDNVTCTESESSASNEAVYAFGNITKKEDGVSKYISTMGEGVFIKYPGNVDTYDEGTPNRAVCIKYSGTTSEEFNCFKWNDYENEKTHVQEVFGGNCRNDEHHGEDKGYIYCEDGWYFCSVQKDGGVGCGDAGFYCSITGSDNDFWSNGTARCVDMR